MGSEMCIRDSAGVEEDALGGCRLAGINVGHDADIATTREWDLALSLIHI